MEKINKTLSKDYLAVKVFADDLKLIESALKEKSTDFAIYTDDYKFDSVEELVNKYKNQKLKSIKISSRSPYVNIELNKLWAKLYCGSDDTTSAGVFYKLDLILSKTARKPQFLYSYHTVWIGNFLIYIIPSFIEKKKIFVIFPFFAISFFLWLIRISYIRISNTSEIILADKGDTQSFFARSKDSIIVGFFLVIVSVILTTIATTYSPSIESFLHRLLKIN